MPLREYKAKTDANCPLCAQAFEHFVSGSQALAECPRCGAPVEQVQASAFQSPEITKPTSYTDAKKAGFTVLKKISDREYEKL